MGCSFHIDTEVVETSERGSTRPAPPDSIAATRTIHSHGETAPCNMAGGLVKYRHLSRSSAHRRALLRNLVTSLIEHESISTTWHKAKEAQRLAEKMITLGKKNTEASKRQALKFFFVRTSHASHFSNYPDSNLAPETPRAASQTLRTPCPTLCQPSWWLYSCPAH